MNIQILTYLPLILLSNLFYAQDILEKNSNWAKYSKVTLQNSHTKQVNVYYLENGKPAVIQLFENDSLISTSKIKNKILSEEKDTINNTYLSDGRILRDRDFNYFYNDKKQLTSKIGLFTYSTRYLYNRKGLISKQFEKQFNGSLGYLVGSMNSFKYDKCNNIIVEKKKSIRLENKETILEDYHFKDPVVLNYQYVYNKDCLWIRKYFVDEKSNKILLSSRIIE